MIAYQSTKNALQFPALKVIVLSVHSEAEAARSALRAGAAGYVLKRTAGTDLREAVCAVRGGRTYVSPAVDMNGIGDRREADRFSRRPRLRLR